MISTPRSRYGLIHWILLVLLALSLTACGGAAAGGEGPAADSGTGDAAAADMKVITREMADTTVQVTVGEQFLVNFGPEYTWKIIVTPGLILGKVEDAEVPEGAQGVYEAMMVGKAVVQGTGTCVSDSCNPKTAQFKINFEIKPGE